MPEISPEDISGRLEVPSSAAQTVGVATDLGSIAPTPVLVVTGGNVVPGQLVVVDAAGTAVASYTAGAPSAPATQQGDAGIAPRVRSASFSLDIAVPDYKIDDVIQAQA